MVLIKGKVWLWYDIDIVVRFIMLHVF